MKYTNMLDVLEAAAERFPNKVALCFLEDGENREKSITYLELLEKAKSFAAYLQEISHQGERAILLYQPGIDYITAFWGCLFGGVIPVPAYPPRNNHHLDRVRTIITNSNARLALTDSIGKKKIEALTESTDSLKDLDIRCYEEEEYKYREYVKPDITPDLIAFLQYTSGSTSVPKGVAVKHSNLLDNLKSIKVLFGSNSNSKIFSWLPPYHDMGLIGGILGPIYNNAVCYFISPAHFVQKPIRWLEAIHKYGITISGGPNFGYEYCVQKTSPEALKKLNLSTWAIAFNGAEPIRSSTLESFAQKFESTGFKRDSFRASYGLAESTLLVAISKPIYQNFDSELLGLAKIEQVNGEYAKKRTLVGIDGFPANQKLEIVNPTSGLRSETNEVGEIWLQSGSVALGYWENSKETNRVFDAVIADGDDTKYLRTGDLGFKHNGALFVSGRIKELMIIRGANYYPTDIEQAAADGFPSLNIEQIMAFSVEIKGAEELIILVEVHRTQLDSVNSIIDDIRSSIVGNLGLQVYEVIPVKRGTIPKTSSGKKERYNGRKLYIENKLERLTSVQKTEKNSNETIEVTRGGDSDHKKSTNYEMEYTAVEAWLISKIAQEAKLDVGNVDPNESFSKYGLDSVKAVQITGELQDWMGTSLSPTLIYEYPTIRTLAYHLSGDRVETNRLGTNNKSFKMSDYVSVNSNLKHVAIVGIGCKFPDAHGPSEFWENLQKGVTSVGKYGEDRFLNPENYYAWKKQVNDKASFAGFINQIDQFDNSFFGITPREAQQMDPQQRLLLQTAWEAFEDSGVSIETLNGTKTGVFIGVSGNDYGLLNSKKGSSADPYLVLGNASSIAANRISYFFNFTGPSISMDTACSSSLVSTRLACQSILNGESTLALAGGVNLVLASEISESFSKANFLSPEYLCKTFDKKADGYVRGEGVGLVVLKELSIAERDGDRIYAVIRGGGINQDGRSNGLTAPNLASQVKVLESAYHDAHVTPGDVTYVEAHGTGTPLGDPIECEALGRVMSVGRKTDTRCKIGSVKTNIGHLEAAAGIAGLIKLALSLHNKEIPRNLNYSEPNPHIDFENNGLQVLTENYTWKQKETPLMVGISSFGFGGTNAHLVLSEHLSNVVDEKSEAQQMALAGIMTLSGKTKGAAERYLDSFLNVIQSSNENQLLDICYTAGVTRSHLPYKISIPFEGKRQLIDRGRELLKEAKGGDNDKILSESSAERKVAFVFSGHGSQWIGMGLEMGRRIPEFQKILENCADKISKLTGWNLIEELNTLSDESFMDKRVDFIQPAIFAIQIALADLWRKWGVKPSAVIGHSMGEVAAAYFVGAIDLDQAVKVICLRSKLAATTQGNGGMLFVSLPRKNLEEFVKKYEPQLTIAAINDPESTVLSGGMSAINDAIQELTSKEIYSSIIKSGFASHCPMMEPLKGELELLLSDMRAQKSEIAFFSGVMGDRIDTDLLDARYWGNNIRNTVNFRGAVESAARFGCNTFIEISPNPILSVSIEKTITAMQIPKRIDVLISSKRDKEFSSFLENAAKAAKLGLKIQYGEVFPRGKIASYLPTYPWSDTSFWIEDANISKLEAITEAGAGRSLIGSARNVAIFKDSKIWERTLVKELDHFLNDHRVDDAVVFPAAGYVELGLCGNDSKLPILSITELNIEKALVLDEFSKIQTSLTDGVLCIHSINSETEMPLLAKMRISAGTDELVGPLFEEIVNQQYDEVSIDEVYSEFQENGLFYGPQFRRVRELRIGQGSSFGCIDVENLPIECQSVLFPGILDSAFQVLGASIRNKKLDKSIYLPVSIDEIRVKNNLTLKGRIYCYSKLDGPISAGKIKGDLSIFDEAGGLCISLKGLQLKAVGANSHLSKWFYNIGWNSDLKEVSKLGGYSKQDYKVFVIGSSGVQEFVEILDRNGVVCTCINPKSFEEIEKKLSSVTEVPGAVIDFTGYNIVASQENRPQSVFDVSKATYQLVNLIEKIWPELTPKIWFVTDRAQPVVNNANMSLEGSALWGMLRSIISEKRHMDIRVVDLDRSENNQCLVSLASVIFINDKEAQLAIRDDTRYVARLRYTKPVLPRNHTFRDDATYLITGGLGALGLETAGWILRNGGKNIILLGRSNGGDFARNTIEKFRNDGANIRVLIADVADSEQMSGVFAIARAEMPPLKGIFHAAGLIEDGSVSHLTDEKLKRVLQPKVAGSWNLHLQTLGDDLDYFVCFSSIASIVGSPGQANYAAANGFMDGLVEYRNGLGIPAVGINWSVWSEIGIGATEERAGRLARMGIDGIPTYLGLDILGGILEEKPIKISVFPLRVDTWVSNSATEAADPFYSNIVATVKSNYASNKGRVASEYFRLSPDEQTPYIERYLKDIISKSIGATSESIGSDVSLVTLGMDSITAVEIKNRVEFDTDVAFPLFKLLDGANIVSITKYLQSGILLAGMRAGSESAQSIREELEVIEL